MCSQVQLQIFSEGIYQSDSLAQNPSIFFSSDSSLSFDKGEVKQRGETCTTDFRGLNRLGRLRIDFFHTEKRTADYRSVPMFQRTLGHEDILSFIPDSAEKEILNNPHGTNRLFFVPIQRLILFRIIKQVNRVKNKVRSFILTTRPSADNTHKDGGRCIC